MPATPDTAPADRAFFGHPRGLAYLAFTECWERFSYYGMNSLLMLYMTGQLLKSGHAENVLGLGALRHLFFQLFATSGQLTDGAFASVIYGTYGGMVYFTPILGGLLADRLFGTKATVVLGALLMCGGHLAMAFDQSFLIALGLLICGSGCLKGNISAQVGELYPQAAESLRTQGYTIFSAGINVGAVLGPLTCGGLAALYGWHVGFGAAAALMLLALIVYLAGQRHLPDGRRRDVEAEDPAPMTRDDVRRTWLLILVAAMTLFPNIAYPMIWGIGVLWVEQHVTLGWVPASWFNSVDAFASIIAVPPLVALWAWQAKRGREPSDVVKIGIGGLLTGASALFFVAGDLLAGAGKTNVIWALAGFVGMGVAFLYYWPVLLALISQAAPKQVKATLMGGVFLSFFLGSLIMGWIGTFYDRMSPAKFWSIDAAIGIVGGLLILAIARPVARALETDTH